VHPDLELQRMGAPFVRGEFVEVLHGFRGDSDDLFGRLVDRTPPSIRSRNKSTWPMWRAYSWIVPTGTSRSDIGPPPLPC
jgi:hypothetical protein